MCAVAKLLSGCFSSAAAVTSLSGSSGAEGALPSIARGGPPGRSQALEQQRGAPGGDL